MMCVDHVRYRDVNSKKPVAAHFLHRGPVDTEWGVEDPLLLPPEAYQWLLFFLT